jgi:MoxR-like ATPase
MNINEVKQLIAAADLCGHVPLIKGLHGIGKSESAAQYATENNLHYEPLILSLMDTGDMLGLPVTRVVAGVESTVWAAPSWYTNIINAAWPLEMSIDRLQFTDNGLQEHVVASIASSTVSRQVLNDLYCEFYNLSNDTLQLARQNKVSYADARRSVLFLDEFNRAPADILNASLQLILDHRLHNHILPTVRGQETLIVAAVNPTGGDYTVQEFDPALLDRFVDCEAEADFKAWLTWAKENNVNKVVIDFLTENQNKFHFVPEDGSKGASPRSWTRLASFIDRVDDTSADIMTHYIKGTVGSALAARFISFYNSYSSSMSSKDLEKLIKKEIARAKRAGNTSPQFAAEAIFELVAEMDAVRRTEFAETYIKDYINKDTAAEAMPMLVYMYALPLESLSAVLKSLQTTNIDDYTQLAILDKEANNKGLFIKLTSNLKGL